ncbi:uncharacterized protein BYT42DRAFT_418369 [Radiomyces spectabilis]|uniref:uncharacterized protein n=1 Tax=Radiomyces spectabilis TaxID=64574 RepID=UPI00221FD3C4|nr:uncharacterized protein BYT42DRAFT_418369 [Radiomyces spectabilis]KAI8374755.1 hypothetical protein BYT42DRAFT_418369 [Radiomyces spectabilis]
MIRVSGAYVITVKFTSPQMDPKTPSHFIYDDINDVSVCGKNDIAAANAKKRLAWCYQYRNGNTDDWKRVIWSDETEINPFNSS